MGSQHRFRWRGVTGLLWKVRLWTSVISGLRGTKERRNEKGTDVFSSCCPQIVRYYYLTCENSSVDWNKEILLAANDTTIEPTGIK